MTFRELPLLSTTIKQLYVLIGIANSEWEFITFVENIIYYS